MTHELIHGEYREPETQAKHIVRRRTSEKSLEKAYDDLSTIQHQAVAASTQLDQAADLMEHLADSELPAAGGVKSDVQAIAEALRVQEAWYDEYAHELRRQCGEIKEEIVGTE